VSVCQKKKRSDKEKRWCFLGDLQLVLETRNQPPAQLHQEWKIADRHPVPHLSTCSHKCITLQRGGNLDLQPAQRTGQQSFHARSQIDG